MLCLLTWSVFVAELDALRGSAVVLQARAKADKKNSVRTVSVKKCRGYFVSIAIIRIKNVITRTSFDKMLLHAKDPDEAIDVDENGEQVELNVTTTTKPTLTGIPQIDYVHDPNLPRELNGYNLTDYPFLNSVPEEIEFKCDGLHDGFYASVPHKCQLYHHCLFGTRFDFLCANYTAFDQKTFICHFVSQVDCPNSAKYFSRNDALYKAAETTTLPTTTTSTTAAPQQQQQQQQQQPQQQQQQQPFYPQYQQQQMPYEGRRAMPPGYAQGRKRRPTYRRRRPVYEYYYVDDYDDQQEYYDDSVEHMPVVKKPIRKHSRFNNYKQADLEADYQESSLESDVPLSGNLKQHRGQHQQHQQQQQQQQQQPRQQQQPSSSAAVTKNVSNQISSVYDKPRAPPKIRRPVPINERDRYDYTSSVSKSSGPQPGPSAPAAALVSTTTATSTTSTTTEAAPAKSAAASRAREPQRPTSTEDPVEYYDDDEEVVADDEYAAEPEVPAAVKSAVTATAAASKPDQAKPVKVVAARTAAVQVVDYDADRGRRPSAFRTKPINRAPATVAPPPPAAPRRRPAADRVADEYEDELPAAATRQSIAAATKQRASGPFLARPSKPTKIINRQPAADVAVDDDGADEPAVVYQQARQPQRVSVRQVTAAGGSHGNNNNRHRPQQQQAAAATQHNGSKQHAARATSAANRMRPAMRPVYEYADEYYDE
ncbi:Uncharacterized protein FWK35_00009241 [Aphis craccivora]|uniref:Chitin-binding type-2 domain-containing protein n=1 Tax=Aphis craccivora TaxID=307492 RepID=A0A6G0Z8J6_APHCR|nr:Uncharacterized protein FWK35_00009241 [Aphis craccivora]